MACGICHSAMRPDCGMKSWRGILRAQPHLDRVPGELDVVLLEPQRLAARDPQLQFDQIEPGDRLGDGVLDLQPRIHLHEIEFAAAIEQELQRAGALRSEAI